MPEQMQSLLEAVGWWVPDEGYPSPDVQMMFERNHRGLCILCEGVLAGDTLLIVDGNGAQHAFCGSACMQDLHVMQQLMTWYDDMAQAVKFRHGGGDKVGGQEEILEEEDEERLQEILGNGGEGMDEGTDSEESETSGEAEEELEEGHHPDNEGEDEDEE